MKRRDFLQTSLLGLSFLLPNLSYAQQKSFLQQFNKNLKNKPWLLGWLGVNEAQLTTSNIELVGKIPKGLSGYFYRNGPAQHQIYQQRYHHWFDGDGMIQQFHIANGKISHFGKMIETNKYLTEKKQQKILLPAFGTYKNYRLKSADEMNPSNISLMPLNNKLFSLWEGGSAYEIDQKNLNTLGVKTWSKKTKGLPFGAHYKKDKDGSVWNIGCANVNDAIVIWHIDKSAKLKQVKILKAINTPMIHDFMITKKYLVLLLPPYNFNKELFAKTSFVDSFSFNKNQGSKVWLIDKDTLKIVKTFELPSQFVFHFVNAYEEGNEVVFESMRYKNADVLLSFSDVMRGEDIKSEFAKHYQVRLNLLSKTATEQEISPIFSEFPIIAEEETGQKHTKVLFLQQRSEVFFNTVALHNNKTQKQQHFSYQNQLAEEHLLVSDKYNKDISWVIGTSLDYINKITNLNIFNADNLSDGPIAIAKLPYVLPLGFHGKFIHS